MISVIVAHDRNRVVGLNGKLPWHISEDLKWFKQVTSNKTVLMGRKTFESLGKPLPNRNNIVLTRDSSFSCEGVEVINSIRDLSMQIEEEIFVIGGSEVYKQFIPFACRLYITYIDYEFEGDTFFPDFKNDNFNESYSREIKTDLCSVKFFIYDKIK